MDRSRHRCQGYMPNYDYSTGVQRCRESLWGMFWIEVGEYTTAVNYCPYCGAKAPVQVPPNWTHDTSDLSRYLQIVDNPMRNNMEELEILRRKLGPEWEDGDWDDEKDDDESNPSL